MKRFKNQITSLGRFAIATVVALLFLSNNLKAQLTEVKPEQKIEQKSDKWYDKLSLRGYTQIRYNRLLETNPLLKNEQGDKSWGDNNGLFIRRARLILSGNVHERVYVYIQPDMAASPGGSSQNFLQLRDLYFDLYLDKSKEYRFRVGQSKVPYGFENMQSSSNRLPFDRDDALNSAVANERDLGTFFYYTPAKVKQIFDYINHHGLKGTGDYGMFGLGVYNGQTANKAEANNNMHTVARFTYPFQFNTANKQIVELSVQGYSGLFVVDKDTVKMAPNRQYSDERVAGTIVIYPQPLGFQAEYNVGQGPEYQSETKSVIDNSLKGGYLMTMYKLDVKGQSIIPFYRYHFYDGGKKHETDARLHKVREHEIGIEYSPIKNIELTAMYTMSERTTSDVLKANNFQSGNLLRLQLQINY